MKVAAQQLQRHNTRRKRGHTAGQDFGLLSCPRQRQTMAMTSAALTIDTDAILANWQALDALSVATVQTAAVVKADAYGLGANGVAKRLAEIGVTHFFVALASEGAALRQSLGNEPEISIFSGHMAGETSLIQDHGLTPMINSPEQLSLHLNALPNHAYGIQLDTGMNRLGIEPADWYALEREALCPTLVMSHLACADEPAHPMNAAQLARFRDLTDGFSFRRSLSATGGILLGPEYHFDLTRPGIGLYGGLPFADARPVVALALPVVQTRALEVGETVGYGNSWTATRPSRIATVAAGYADGLLRAMGGQARVFAGDIACPIVGRVSMDLITVNITDLTADPDQLVILGAHQGVDTLANAAGTIGYEILTSLGSRYKRLYKGAP